MTSTETPQLLLVGAGTMGQAYVPAAHRLGCRVVLVDRPETPARDLLRPGDALVPLRGASEEACDAAVEAALASHRIDAVWPFTEPHVVPAALAATRLGLPGTGLHAAVVSRNKAYQRSLFARRGLPQPAHVLAGTLDEAHEWADGRGPVVLKPLRSTGSSGVVVARGDTDDVRATLASAWESGPALVEEYVTGPELSYEAVVQGGRVCFDNITEKCLSDGPYPVELEHRVPPDLLPDDATSLARLGHQVVEALDVQAALVHLEVRWGPSGPVIMEVAVRTPGDYIMELVELATGIDLFEAGIALALGRSPELHRERDEAAASLFPRAAPGRVRRIGGVEEVRAMAGVERLRLSVSPGDEVRPLRSSLDRVGSVLLRAPDRAELLRRRKAIWDTLDVVTES